MQSYRLRQGANISAMLKANAEASYKLQVNLLGLITEILIIYNCRISEILSANSSNLIQDKFLILKGAKKSQDVIIRDRVILARFSKLKTDCYGNYFYNVTYNQVYKYVKSNFGHILKSIAHNKNEKITHAFRYNNVKEVNDEQSIKAILHHNSVKSQKYYKK